MELIQTKSLLAKLMAQENLTVEQRKVHTAYFDVENRVLVVPVLDKNISGYLYDLFMGHEVGHALYTPLDGLKKAKEIGISMTVMNVLEDVRIERKIKNKYPGIRQSFVRGYNELIDKNFFETDGVNLNDLNFIDRVNMFAKGGAQQGITFTDDEQILVKKIENTETYDDVIALAQEIGEYLKKEQEQKLEKVKVLAREEQESDENDDFDEDFDEEMQDFDDSDTEESEEDDGNLDSQLQTQNGHDDKDQYDEDHETEQQVTSKTDEAWRRNENKLFASEKRHYYYGNIPDVDLNRVIVSHRQLWARYRKWTITHMFDENDKLHGFDKEGYANLRTDSKKVVAYLTKEFEMRRNADQMKRATTAKTGELNMEKIYSFKFNEDLFKKITVVPGGKSHGLVMFLDWSGSMVEHLTNTVKQLYNLALFCKKVNIPFEVYAFSGSYYQENQNSYTPRAYKPTLIGDIDMNNMHLLNIISSKMTASELSNAFSALLYMSKIHGIGRWRYQAKKPEWFELGNTPLNESIICAMKIVPQFKKDYRLQIVNTIFLSDGDGHNTYRVLYRGSNGSTYIGQGNNEETAGVSRWSGSERVFVIRDPKTKHEESIEVDRSSNRQLTTAYIKLLKKVTGCNIVGFYILNGRHFGNEIRNLVSKSADIEKLRVDFRKNKYQIITSAGFDEYYLLRADGMDTDEDAEFEVKENASTRSLVSAFTKYAGNRVTNRIVLNRFIGLIA